MHPADALAERLASLRNVVLGYSGGVDSALLAVAGRRALGAGQFLAVIGRSASYPAAQYRHAVALAARFDVPLLELDTAELDDPRYRANAPDRCYFCKQELWTRLAQVAAERGGAQVIDGTNADDLGEHRPGARAGLEHGVISPLADLGLGKPAVRALAQSLGIDGWDAPASPCLASRIAYGVEVTDERLAQVEEAEAWLRDHGIAGDLRVRLLGDAARVEVLPMHRRRLEELWPAFTSLCARLGIGQVTIDPLGYRRGAMLAILGQAS